MVGYGEVVFGTRYPPYEVKRPGDELFTVVGKNVQGDAVRLNSIFQKPSGNCTRCSILKRVAPRYFGEPVNHVQDEGILPRACLKRAE